MDGNRWEQRNWFHSWQVDDQQPLFLQSQVQQETSSRQRWTLLVTPLSSVTPLDCGKQTTLSNWKVFGEQSKGFIWSRLIQSVWRNAKNLFHFISSQSIHFLYLPLIIDCLQFTFLGDFACVKNVYNDNDNNNKKVIRDFFSHLLKPCYGKYVFLKSSIAISFALSFIYFD